MQGNIRAVPRGVSQVAGREEFSYKAMWVFVNRKSSGKKNVLALSSVPPLLGVTMDDGKHKPAILKLCDFTKGGTDVVDQRMGKYAVNTTANRWTIPVFSYLLDAARVNSQSQWSLTNDRQPSEGNSFYFIF